MNDDQETEINIYRALMEGKCVDSMQIINDILSWGTWNIVFEKAQFECP